MFKLLKYTMALFILTACGGSTSNEPNSSSGTNENSTSNVTFNSSMTPLIGSFVLNQTQQEHVLNHGLVKFFSAGTSFNGRVLPYDMDIVILSDTPIDCNINDDVFNSTPGTFLRYYFAEGDTVSSSYTLTTWQRTDDLPGTGDVLASLNGESNGRLKGYSNYQKKNFQFVGDFDVMICP